MHGGTRGHARTIQSLAIAQSQQLNLSQWATTASDLAVQIGSDILYPDLIVEAVKADVSASSTSSPILVS
jgi:hypothetical protein